MDVLQSWGIALTTSLESVWKGVISFVPVLILALVIFAIGWIFAMLVEKLVEGIFKGLKVDAALRSAGMEDVVKRSGYSLNSGVFIGALVKWFVIVVFLMASFDILGLKQVNQFLGEVANFLPQVIVSVLIIMVAAIVARTMERIVVAGARAGHVHVAELLGSITKWAIWVFAFITAIINLGVASNFIQMLVTTLFAGGALAFGLAFGLGGKNAAERIVNKTVDNFWD